MTSERERATTRTFGREYTRRDVLRGTLAAGVGALTLTAFGGIGTPQAAAQGGSS